MNAISTVAPRGVSHAEFELIKAFIVAEDAFKFGRGAVPADVLSFIRRIGNFRLRSVALLNCAAKEHPQMVNTGLAYLLNDKQAVHALTALERLRNTHEEDHDGLRAAYTDILCNTVATRIQVAELSQEIEDYAPLIKQASLSHVARDHEAVSRIALSILEEHEKSRWGEPLAGQPSRDELASRIEVGEKRLHLPEMSGVTVLGVKSNRIRLLLQEARDAACFATCPPPAVELFHPGVTIKTRPGLVPVLSQ